MTNRAWVPFAASAVFYSVVVAILGREVLADLSSAVANDAGDPLLTAAILKWNATHLPLTDAWWQFPIFYPTRDTLTFSEHLLGLSVVASPIYWLTGNTLVTYNLVTLLTFPLCALAMYVLVFRLTGSAAGAFVGGLAFGFAPYRVAQLSHIQMLAAFWAPLAFAGLHAYLDSGKRRWLALYGAAWMLQGATNGYALVLLSVLIGCWVLWFVVAHRNWRALAMIAMATTLALLPLVPVLYKYTTVHAYHGFSRTATETRAFSADVSAILCAPDGLSLWGWLRAGCYPAGVLLREVELFPGVATILLCGAYVVRALRLERGAVAASTHRLLRLARQVPPLSATRTAAHRSSTTWFYLLAALAMWSLALGPMVTFAGVPSGVEGPFAWLFLLPGADNLRVPARFWLMTVLCLAVVAGTSLSDIIRGRSGAFTRGALLLAAVGVLSDSWLDRIPTQPAPSPAPNAARLAGAPVLELPPDANLRDIAATFRAVDGGWTTINGYSGYEPSYYQALRNAARAEDENVLEPFRRSADLNVLVPVDAPRLTALVERQPGVTIVGRNAAMVQYWLPRRSISGSARAAGHRERELPSTSGIF